MADILLVSTGFAAGVFLVGLAAVVLSLRAKSPMNQAFALFAGLQGAGIFLVSLARVSDASFREVLQTDLIPSVLIGQVAAILIFAVASSYRWPGRNWVFAALVAAAAVAITFHVLDGCLSVCRVGPEASAGPLYTVEYGAPFFVSLVGAFLVFEGRHFEGSRRSRALLMGVALSLNALVDAFFALSLLVTNDLADFQDRFVQPAWPTLGWGLRSAALILSLLALVRAAQLHAADNQGRRRILWMVLAVGLMLGSVLVLVAAADEGKENPSAATFLVGLWRMVTPAIVAYGLLKHRLFRFDPAIKKAVGRTPIAALCLAVFFIVSKIVENILGDLYGAIGGGIAAGLALFALSPLERVGSRVADALMPRSKPVEKMAGREKHQLYRDQASLVWADGVMRAKEKLLLENLRQKLKISAETAARIELEASRSAMRRTKKAKAT